MNTFSSTLSALQASAVSLLSSDPVYAGQLSANGQAIPIITEKKGDIKQQVDLCLGQVGICALVMVPTFEFHQPKVQDLSGWAALIVAIYENPTLNSNGIQGTGICALDLCVQTVGRLHWAPHGVPTAATASESRFLSAPRTIELASNGPPLQFNALFQAHITLNTQYQ
jgi:hypothetical protein